MKNNKENWFIPNRINNSDLGRSIKSRDSKQDGQFKVRYCTACERVHENVWDYNRSVVNYYDEFPSIGLDRSDCRLCKIDN